MELPDKLTPAMIDALGQPNFRTAPIAHLFREHGAAIATHFEEEQAYVLFWSLRLAIEHDIAWRAKGGEEISRMVDEIKARKSSAV